MSQRSLTIPKLPLLKPAEDYHRLRREGIGFIEQMGSRLWTDYNASDSGIAIHEALCYAITDLGYRTGWDIADILAPALPSPDKSQPFPNQSFFPAREILTVNPWTADDFRRLLIDLESVRNAWIFCKECACDTVYYAWCEQETLPLSYLPPEQAGRKPKQVWPLGLYEALLELEADPDSGDLNDRKIESALVLPDANGAQTIVMELRFQEAALSDREQWALFLAHDDAFAGRNGESFNLKLISFGATKSYDVLSDPNLDDAGRNGYLRRHWRNIFYLSFEIELLPGGKKIVLENAALRLFGTAGARDAVTVQGLKAVFEERSANGLLQRYRKKEQLKAAAVASAKRTLFAHRNLDEDFCRVKVVGIDEIAVCADVEVAPDADIERVQAQIWFEIEQYFNPPVPFYSLQELLDAGTPVEEIFNGPALASGFIKAEDLAAASLKSVLCVSDIINRLMEIEGVIAVNQLQMTRYDAEGAVVSGAADPTWSSEGKPIFDPGKTSASWLLYLSAQHQPRLYRNASRFLFYKNGLPFHPRMDEALDTLTQLRGEAERSKIRSAAKDLPVPAGNYRNPDLYSPVQYSFPLTYGIGPDGLPSHASAQRRAQARQLKAYLMVFEQILGNAFAQLAHTADLFSLDPQVERTYFVTQFTEAIIKGYGELINGLDKTVLEAMVETGPEFRQRRNRFLDHLMARFGEEYCEYTLLLIKLHGKEAASDRLIEDKISFLLAYPLISHDRGKAFDHLLAPCTQGNQPGLKKRISLLLGYPDLSFRWHAVAPATGTGHQESLNLADGNDKVWFEAGPGAEIAPLLTAFLQELTPRVPPDSYQVGYATGEFLVRLIDSEGSLLEESTVKPLANAASGALRDGLEKAFRELLVQMIQPEAYRIVAEPGQFRLQLEKSATEIVGRSPEPFKTQAEAETLRDELLAWSANERMIVVEHLLLRPKFPGDALYPACSDGACNTCGAEDPYSFRLSFVMPGWTAPFNTDLEMRGFADRAIRQEIPAHLVGKICWVGNDGFVEKLCDPVIVALAQLLGSQGRTTGGVSPTDAVACDCAAAIYSNFSAVFEEWYEDRILQHSHSDAMKMELELEFGAKVKVETITCAAVLEPELWSTVSALMVEHFRQVALYGWQFERFEAAWCKWLELNATFDWTEERLQERVAAILALNLVSVASRKHSESYQLCRCADAILNNFGAEYYQWMDGLFRSGSFTADATLPTFPVDLTLCPGLSFKGGTVEKIRALLEERYHAYREVSYRLWVVLSLLGELSNSYPAATLHDCDEGNDKNPVRLGKTALGS